MLDRTVWGPLEREENRALPDLAPREIAALAPLCALMLWIGLAPKPFLEPSRPALEAVLAAYQARAAAPPPAAPALREAAVQSAAAPEAAP
jgi:NADH-quinone oxidoreductase subunit M